MAEQDLQALQVEANAIREFWHRISPAVTAVFIHPQNLISIHHFPDEIWRFHGFSLFWAAFYGSYRLLLESLRLLPLFYQFAVVALLRYTLNVTTTRSQTL